MTTLAKAPLETTRDDRRAAAHSVFRVGAGWMLPRVVRWIESGDEGADGDLAPVARIAEDFAAHRRAAEAAGYERRRQEELASPPGDASPEPTREDREDAAHLHLVYPETIACYRRWIETGDDMHCVHRPYLGRSARRFRNARIDADSRGFLRGRRQGHADMAMVEELLRGLVASVTAYLETTEQRPELRQKLAAAQDWIAASERAAAGKGTSEGASRAPAFLYRASAFEAAARYLAEHNPHCKGDVEWVRRSLHGLMQSLSRHQWALSASSLGAHVQQWCGGEGRDTHFQIYVDPTLSGRDYTETEFVPAAETAAGEQPARHPRED